MCIHVDANDIKITLANFGCDLDRAENVVVVGGGAWLNLTVEDNTEKEIQVACPYAMVNGIMIEMWNSDYIVSTGETLDATMELDYDNLIESNIRTVSSVCFVMGIMELNPKTYEKTSIDTKYIRLSTSAADYVQPEYTPSGTPVLDENGITAYYLGSEYDGYSWKYRIYIENGTDKMVSARLNDPMADGTDALYHTFFANEVLFPNSTAIMRIVVQTGDEDYNGSDEIAVLTGALTVSQYGDDSIVYSSEQVSWSPKNLEE